MATEHPTAVLHLDMDTFFVSVERLHNPALVGKPVLVGGSATRGVVSACSYETRPYGVRSGMAMRQAIKFCPDAIIISANHANYGAYARQVRSIVEDHVPIVEFASIDECYCDFSGLGRYQDSWELARRLRSTIQTETGLPLSMCLATSKTMAKIGTGLAKPYGELHVLPGEEIALLEPLPVQKIPGLGPRANQILAREGIYTIGDIQRLVPEELERLLGVWGITLWRKAHGLHLSSIHTGHICKQIGKETTFDNASHEPRFLRSRLFALAEMVGSRLRRDGRFATSVTLKLRYADFETHTHQCRVPPTQSDRVIGDAAQKLFRQIYICGRPVRLVGVTVSGLVEGGDQLELFANRLQERQASLAKDALNRRLGKPVVRTAATLPPKST